MVVFLVLWIMWREKVKPTFRIYSIEKKKRKDVSCMKRNFLTYPFWESWIEGSGLLAAWFLRETLQAGRQNSLFSALPDLNLSLASPVQAARQAAASEGAEESVLESRGAWTALQRRWERSGVHEPPPAVLLESAGEECTWCPGENNVRGLLLASHLKVVKMATEAVSGFMIEIPFSFPLFPLLYFFHLTSCCNPQQSISNWKSFRQQDPESARIPACCPQASWSQGNGQCIKELLCVTQGDQIKPSAWIVVRGCWCIVSFL